jgi:antitoxin VapB
MTVHDINVGRPGQQVQTGVSPMVLTATRFRMLATTVEVMVYFHHEEGGKMALNIKNRETHRLAQELAEATGESITEAVRVAIRERLASLHQQGRGAEVRRSVREIQAFVRRLPDRDARPADEILGYDEFGLPR